MYLQTLNIEWGQIDSIG